MPRSKPPTAGNEPKKRSRTGCHGCKNRKVKCDEAKPRCSNCVKLNEECDYSLKLQWGGRSKKEQNAFSAMANATSGFSTINFAAPGASPAAAVPTSAQTPSGSEGQYSTPDVANRDSSSRVDTQSTSFNHETEQEAQSSSYTVRPSTYPEPPNSYSSLPQFALPNPYHSMNPPTGQHYRSPSLTRPPSPYDFAWSSEDRTKRVRLVSGDGPPRSLPPLLPRPGLPEPVGSSFSPYDQPSPGASYMSVNSAPSPLTPGSSSAHASPGLRRLSVNYLLSGPAGDHASPRSSYDRFGGYRKVEDGCTIYGYDYGLPDLDIPKNDDNGAINPQTPAASMQSPSLSDAAWSPSQLYESPLEKPAFERGGYYARPVPIRIPLELESLPAQLSDSPMNLIYFHHFLNHTARILVPHDCPDNPLKSTLPRSTLRQQPNYQFETFTDMFFRSRRTQSKSTESPPRLLSIPPCPPPVSSRTSKSYSNLAPRRLPLPPPLPLLKLTNLKRHPDHRNHARLPRMHKPGQPRRFHPVATTPQHRTPNHHFQRWLERQGR